MNNIVGEKKIFTPSEINKLLNEILEDLIPNNINIQGEVTNISKSNSGHIYFSLKDKNSSIISGVFWKNFLDSKKNNKDFLSNFKDGAEIICSGRLSNYNGKISLSVLNFECINTQGALFIEFEKTKRKLEKLGFFDISKKKPLVKFPRTICLITSKSGSVLHDMLNRIKARFGLMVYFIAVSVQGESSIKQIKNAIDFANQKNNIFEFDLIILARGGGSFEELSIFNNEEIVKSVFYSKIPIISAIGHETDFTLVDFSADLRAPTPSSAIEIALPVKSNIEDMIYNLVSKIKQSMQYKLNQRELRFNSILKNFSEKIIFNKIENKKLQIKIITENIYFKINNSINKIDAKLKFLSLSIEKHNHIDILNRGYSLCWNLENKKIISSRIDFEKIKNKNKILIEFKDGKVNFIDHSC